MIWLFAFLIVGYLIINFSSDLNKDNYDLDGQTLDQKFSVIVNILNKAAFNGSATVTPTGKRTFNLTNEQNQLIRFHFSTGHLTIYWFYKFYQKEVVHERQFNDDRNLSIFEQQKIAEQMIKEMAIVVEQHKNKVLRGI